MGEQETSNFTFTLQFFSEVFTDCVTDIQLTQTLILFDLVHVRAFNEPINLECDAASSIEGNFIRCCFHHSDIMLPEEQSK